MNFRTFRQRVSRREIKIQREKQRKGKKKGLLLQIFALISHAANLMNLNKKMQFFEGGNESKLAVPCWQKMRVQIFSMWLPENFFLGTENQ